MIRPVCMCALVGLLEFEDRGFWPRVTKDLSDRLARDVVGPRDRHHRGYGDVVPVGTAGRIIASLRFCSWADWRSYR